MAVDLSSWSAIRAYGAERFRANLDAAAPDVVFANEPEWEMVGGAYALAETAVVKRGSRGVEVRSPEGVEEFPPPDAEVVDTTGAGDALAAGFLVGGIELGLEAAARCVREARSGAVIRIAAGSATTAHEGGPVVALETTLVAHGFPPGVGVEVGRAAEAAVRAEGAMPATVGVLDGQVVVGLDAGELERFGEAGAGARKAGPRDLAACVASGELGATTVGGTLAAARLAGHPLHGHRRDRRRPPRLRGAPRRLRRPGAARAHAGARRLLRDQVAARRPRDRRAARDAGRAGARLPHDELPLFYSAGGGPPVSARVDDAGRRRRARPKRTGSSAAQHCCSRATPTTASTSSR